MLLRQPSISLRRVVGLKGGSPAIGIGVAGLRRCRGQVVTGFGMVAARRGTGSRARNAIRFGIQTLRIRPLELQQAMVSPSGLKSPTATVMRAVRSMAGVAMTSPVVSWSDGT